MISDLLTLRLLDVVDCLMLACVEAEVPTEVETD